MLVMNNFYHSLENTGQYWTILGAPVPTKSDPAQGIDQTLHSSCQPNISHNTTPNDQIQYQNHAMHIFVDHVASVNFKLGMSHSVCNATPSGITSTFFSFKPNSLALGWEGAGVMSWQAVQN